MKKYLLLLAFASIIASCKQEKKPEESRNNFILPPISNIFESYHQAKLALNPLEATAAGDHRYNHLLPNSISKDHLKKLRLFYKTYKDSLSFYGDALLSEEEKLSKAILKWEIDLSLKGLEFRSELMPINQMFALPLTIGQLASGKSYQPFKTVKDYRNWLARIKSFSSWCDTAKYNMKTGIEKGYVLPKPLIKKVIPQLKSLTKGTEKTNIFYSPLKKFPDNFSTDEKKSITEDYTQVLEKVLFPKINQLVAFIETDYLEAGRLSSGINALPEGKRMYSYLIENYTTTKMSYEEIHKLGLREVERIASEMNDVKNQVDFEGTLPEFFEHIRTKRELKPFKKPYEVIENFNRIHRKMQPYLEKLFDLSPKTAFEVRRTEAFREASASAQYNPGSIDGSRPGIFYVPIPNVKQYNTFTDEDLFLHEAIPGHHYQISLQQENNNLPSFRKTLWYSAYGEGWALYTESLGKELGLYEDPYQYFGMLSAEMHRAIRLVVDTGLHAKGWTREDAIEFSLKNEAQSRASIEAEIERYMAIPGQALSYKIGQLKIKELRRKAEENLKEKFDIKIFHNKILESGSMPLYLLEQKINRWIETQKQL